MRTFVQLLLCDAIHRRAYRGISAALQTGVWRGDFGRRCSSSSAPVSSPVSTFQTGRSAGGAVTSVGSKRSWSFLRFQKICLFRPSFTCPANSCSIFLSWRRSRRRKVLTSSANPRICRLLAFFASKENGFTASTLSVFLLRVRFDTTVSRISRFS